MINNKLYKSLLINNNSHFLRRFTTNYLSEHCGFHLKVSLFLERQPLEYSENEVYRLYRQFKEFWSIKTSNSLKIPSLSTIERKITHKLSRSKEHVVKPSITDSSDTSQKPILHEDLESLLSGELDLSLLPRRSRRKLEKEAADKVSKLNVDDDLHNVNRLPKSWIFFLVKYKDSSWSLPTTDLYYGHTIRQTLFRLCDEQISETYRPYFLGYSPFTHQKIPFKSQLNLLDINNNQVNVLNNTNNPEEFDVINGFKVFYYRARHIPSCQLPDISNEYIEDYAWCSFTELESKLDKFKYHRVLNSLPLFDLKSL